MANPTSNFNWQMPTSSDLVTDLPADFEVFGQAVDTSLADLKGGTTGQVLKKNSNTDMDFVWGADSAGMTNPMTTTGDTIYSSSGSTPARLGIGSTGQVLTVSGGLPAWSAAPAVSSNWSLLNAGGTSLTGATTITISGISGQDKIMILLSGGSSANGSSDVGIRFNADTTNANYQWYGTRITNGSAFSQTAISTTNGGGDPYFKFAVFSDNAASAAFGFLILSGGNSSGVKVINGAISANAASGTNQRQDIIGGYYAGTSTISSVSLVSSSGNWDAGTVFIYGSA
jgi:hypothetical protein